MGDGRTQTPDSQAEHQVRLCAPKDLDGNELARCVNLVATGQALERDYVERNLPDAVKLAVVSLADEIVAVGAIKAPNPRHAKTVAAKAGFAFAEHTPELGYIRVDDAHGSRRLSSKVYAALLQDHREPLFAVTDDARMKHLLGHHGFLEQGRAFHGRRGNLLTLWVRLAVP